MGTRPWRSSENVAFARPKSSTFTVPAAVSLMFAGLRSRWMIPFSCAASSASAIWRASTSASSTGNGAAGKTLGEGRALDQLHYDGVAAACDFEAVDGGDIRMVQRREQPRLALQPRDPIEIVGQRRRAGP